MTRALLLLALIPAALSSGELGPLYVVSRPALYRIARVYQGEASYYAPHFHGRAMKNGHRYDLHRLTAASNTIPLGRVVLVTRADRPWRTVTVKITDTGNLHGRLLDLSGSAACKLGMLHEGIVPITVMEVTKDG